MIKGLEVLLISRVHKYRGLFYVIKYKWKYEDVWKVGKTSNNSISLMQDIEYLDRLERLYPSDLKVIQARS